MLCQPLKWFEGEKGVQKYGNSVHSKEHINKLYSTYKLIQIKTHPQQVMTLNNDEMMLFVCIKPFASACYSVDGIDIFFYLHLNYLNRFTHLIAF